MERELTKFERALANMIHAWGTPNESPFNLPEELHEDAEILLTLAREQFFNER